MNLLRILLLITITMGAGCSLEELVGMQPEKDSDEKAAVDPKLPPGTCSKGMTTTAPDGCNTCSCDESGNWACTEMGCEVEWNGECQEELPAGLQELINAAYARNQSARDAAVAAEAERLKVSKLQVTEELGSTYDGSSRYKPETDPYPNSVVVYGGDYDVRAEGYEINHGKMDMTRIYETSSGSKEYFIVDRIGGDGMGGNGASVIAENVEYKRMNLLQDQNSYHSWYVASDNTLVRAYQDPTDDLQEELYICGCGPGGYEVDAPERMNSGAAADFAAPEYKIGIFKLPADTMPKILDEESFKAGFDREFYKKTYVPAKGKQCMTHEAVC